MSHHHHDDHRHVGPFKKIKFGTNGDDAIPGSNHSDIILGFGGNDTIVAGLGNDIVLGGRGNDWIDGGKGNDTLFGESGNDALIGGNGNDDLHGGRGRDLLLGDAGRDHLSGDEGNDKFLLRKGMGVDTIERLDAGDRIDVRDFNILSFQTLIDSARQVGHHVQINLGHGDTLIIEHARISDLHAEQFILSNEVTGTSSSQTPHLLSSNSHVYTESLLTTGDSVNGYKMAGIPDGLGAFDNGDGTFTVLMNHELPGTAGIARAHGGTGSFVSEWVIDKTTLQVVSGKDLIHDVWMYEGGTYVDHNAGNSPVTFNRFCSADLADSGAFYNAQTGLGFDGRLYLTGEEGGVEGRAFAHVVGGPQDGNSYELAWLGNMAYENVVANAHTGDKTVVAMMDDGQNGQVYFYSGTKQATGNVVEKAGLTGGHLLGIHVSEFEGSANNAPSSTSALGTDEKSAFTMIDLGDVSGKTGAQIDADSETAGVTSFLRPEDGAWDTLNPNRFYFVSTNAFNAPSQLWALDFTDASHPELGGTIKLLLNGSEGQQMLDNITVDSHGKLILSEDVGNNAHLGKVWQYDPATDSLTQLAQHDASRFVTGGANFLTQDEEASGVIDVSHILGNAGENVYLIDTQSHLNVGGELVEGGQLQLIHQYLV
ncbi:alkaline phosphatase PhoX [Bradyrhizobium liaoningense]|uniref:alkaline phosphatase PhoX n=1 Tax=Bradyrhizobium liaoningense TaxID=43992 RepID=UPI0004B854EE|nr:alkaline phosphatase PhoX [Bradyrhizobium liaoningense]